MQTTTPQEALKARISILETQKTTDADLLKKQLKTAYESLKPANLLRTTISELVSTPGLKGNLLDTAIGYTAGHLSKKVVTGSSNNPFKQLLGTFLQMAVTAAVSKNAGDIRSGMGQLFSMFFAKKNVSE